jgi:hypothetical protein
MAAMDRGRVLGLVVVALAACGANTTSFPPQPTAPDGARVLLRMEMEEAIPPRDRFGTVPPIVITLDGRALTAGATPAIFPGPAVGPIVQRQISPAGWTKIVELARASGLLQGTIVIGELAPGETVIHLSIVGDGRVHEIRGSNHWPGCIQDPCQGPPGSPQAFIGFGSRLFDLATLLGPELGPEEAFLPEAYGVIVGAVPDDQELPQPPLGWPLAGAMAAFGNPFADGSGFRCGTVSGDDVATLRVALGKANQLTPWQDPLDGSRHGLTVRPLLPGDDDPCAGIV